MVFILTSLIIFCNELSVCKKFITENNLITDYTILDLGLKNGNEYTYLFFNPYNDASPDNNIWIPFTDAVLIKTDGINIIQFLKISKNGLVKSNDEIIFYDFSESGYSHLEFNGWLLKTGKMVFDNSEINTVSLQLTNDGINLIPADPSLPIILWDFPLNYPVKYKYTMYPLSSPIWLIEYEWREDIKISCARTGLRDNEMLKYIAKLSDTDKRIIINAMFALAGYEFKTDEWKIFFNKFKWYKPDNTIKNDLKILNDSQRKLFDVLSN